MGGPTSTFPRRHVPRLGTINFVVQKVGYLLCNLPNVRLCRKSFFLLENPTFCRAENPNLQPRNHILLLASGFVAEQQNVICSAIKSGSLSSAKCGILKQKKLLS